MMTRLNKEIIKRSGCRAIDITFITLETHKKDLTRRLKKQEKALVKTIAKGWMGQEAIEGSIVSIKTTLKIVCDMLEEQNN